MLLTARSLGDYTVLCNTLDDAVGEAIDKTARALGLAWAEKGGPGAALERAAAAGDPDRLAQRLPLPMSTHRNKNTLAWSFAGLKTAVTRLVQLEPTLLDDPQSVSDLAAAFQMTCVRHLEHKLTMALDREIQNTPLTALVVSGGVASNQLIRSRYALSLYYQCICIVLNVHIVYRLGALAQSYGLRLVCPPPRLCTDNGVMIAWTGLERFQAGLVDEYTITTRPKWSIESLKEKQDPL